VSAGLLGLAAFAAGAVVVVWSTERLLDGMVGLARLLRLTPFVIAGVLSGLEAENVAVGLTSGAAGVPEVALGTVFGGGIFVVCVALGLGAVLYPLRVRLPRGLLLAMAATPVLAGLALIGASTPRVSGVVLLAAFAGAMAYLVLASRRHRFLEVDEVLDTGQRPGPWWRAVLLTLLGIAAVTLGAELVTFGAGRMIAAFAIPAGLIGMVVTPAAIEAEEIVRQAVPARGGRPDVSAGNLVGTLFYFVLFNLGLVAALVPVRVAPTTRTVDWPFLVGSTWLAAAFLWRGQVTRRQGALLLVVYAAYVAVHLVVR
jgi:cation:H+ antiporter